MCQSIHRGIFGKRGICSCQMDSLLLPLVFRATLLLWVQIEWSPEEQEQIPQSSTASGLCPNASSDLFHLPGHHFQRGSANAWLQQNERSWVIPLTSASKHLYSTYAIRVLTPFHPPCAPASSPVPAMSEQGLLPALPWEFPLPRKTRDTADICFEGAHLTQELLPRL